MLINYNSQMDSTDVETNEMEKSKKYRVVQIDGNTALIEREFATSGNTILEGVISMLLDIMEKQNEQKITN